MIEELKDNLQKGMDDLEAVMGEFDEVMDRLLFIRLKIEHEARDSEEEEKEGER